jgi:di/tricarboxylate transporter
MSFDLIIVLIILVITLALFVSNRLRLDVVALLSLLALVFAGAVSVDEALAGFSNPLVLMVAGLFVVGAALFHTGVADTIGRWVLTLAGASPLRLIVVLMAVTAFLSAFLSSTGTVAVMLPVALAIARGRNIAPSRLLMPLAFASLLGGMLTLIGTPPNLVVSTQLVQAGFEPFGFFAFSGPGIVMLLVGIAFMAFASAWLTPDRGQESLDNGPGWFDLFTEYQLENCLARVRVPAGSALVGQAVSRTGLRVRFQVTALAMVSVTQHGRIARPAEPGSMIQAGDHLYLCGEPARIEEAVSELGLELGEWRPALPAPLQLVDALIPPRSAWIGKTLRELRLHSGAGVTVIAQHPSGGESRLVDLDRTLAAGNVLLLTGKLADLRNVSRDSRDLVLLGGEGLVETPRTDLAPLAMIVMLSMLAAMTFNWLPNVVAVLTAAVVLVLTRCLNAQEAYRHINWESVVLIAAILPMGTALDNTGGLRLASETLLGLSGHYGPLVILGVLFVFTSSFSLMVSNTATAVLVAPVALQTAITMDLSPYPFLMTVAIAASTAFATPVASPVNTLVLNPGGYRFGDFVRVGLPLQFLLLIATLIVVPWMFPL